MSSDQISPVSYIAHATARSITLCIRHAFSQNVLLFPQKEIHWPVMVCSVPYKRVHTFLSSFYLNTGKKECKMELKLQ